MPIKAKQRRPKGEGSIYQLSNGKYRTQVDIGYTSEGKRKRKTITGESPKDIINKLNQLKSDKVTGALTVVDEQSFSKFVDRWLLLKRPPITKESTYDAYRRIVNNKFKPYFKDVPISKITSRALNDYINELIISGLKPKTIHSIYAVLFNIFKYAEEEDVIQKNPMRKTLALPKLQRRKSMYLSEEDIQSLLNYTKTLKDKNTVLGKMHYLILLALATGARYGELTALKWAAIDTKKAMIHISDNLSNIEGKGLTISSTKTEKSTRSISIDPQVLKELQVIKGDSPFVFTNSASSLFNASNVHRALKRILKKVPDVPNIRFHDLRHTHATLLIAKGVDIKTVSERLGHKNIQLTLNLYAHVLPKNDIKAALVMGEIVCL